MIIRRATEQEWPLIYPFYAVTMAEGKTYAFPEGQDLEEARPWWMEQPPGQTVVAVKGDTIVGSAKMGANRPGRGSHIAKASFLVDPAHQGQGVGRALGQYVLDWSRAAGFTGIQFNAVVESNAPAVHLWQSLGFKIIGTDAGVLRPPRARPGGPAYHVPPLVQPGPGAILTSRWPE